MTKTKNNPQGIELGDTVEDTISGFKGIVTGEHKYLNGCLQFSVRPKVGKDNAKPQGVSLDVEELKLLEKGDEAKKAMKAEPTGGPERVVSASREYQKGCSY